MHMMTNEEKTLLDRCGNRNVFRTPEHYFDELPQRVMNRIPRQKRQHRNWQWAVAAVMTGIVASIGLLMMEQSKQADIAYEADNNQYIEDMLDYSMIDNTEIATYLTEAE